MRKGFKITSSIPSTNLVDVFTYKNIQRNRFSIKASRKGQEFDLSWLDKAAVDYDISANPEDYVFNKLKALTIDLPNRNMYAFPMDEVVRFSKEHGKPVYKTFEGKPVYFQHDQVFERARGFILHSDIETFGCYSYITLINAIDKKKDPKLAAQAADINQPIYYSMGSTAYRLICGICGNEGMETNEKCVHIKKNPRGAILKGWLNYEEARDVCYDEISGVYDPADFRATRSDIDHYSLLT